MSEAGGEGANSAISRGSEGNRGATASSLPEAGVVRGLAAETYSLWKSTRRKWNIMFTCHLSRLPCYCWSQGQEC